MLQFLMDFNRRKMEDERRRAGEKKLRHQISSAWTSVTTETPMSLLLLPSLWMGPIRALTVRPVISGTSSLVPGAGGEPLWSSRPVAWPPLFSLT